MNKNKYNIINHKTRYGFLYFGGEVFGFLNLDTLVSQVPLGAVLDKKQERKPLDHDISWFGKGKPSCFHSQGTTRTLFMTEVIVRYLLSSCTSTLEDTF